MKNYYVLKGTGKFFCRCSRFFLGFSEKVRRGHDIIILLVYDLLFFQITPLFPKSALGETGALFGWCISWCIEKTVGVSAKQLVYCLGELRFLNRELPFLCRKLRFLRRELRFLREKSIGS